MKPQCILILDPNTTKATASGRGTSPRSPPLRPTPYSLHEFAVGSFWAEADEVVGTRHPPPVLVLARGSCHTRESLPSVGTGHCTQISSGAPTATPPGLPTHPLGTRCHPQPTPPSSPSSGSIHPSSGAHGQLPLTPVCPSIWALTVPAEAPVVPGAGPAVIHRGANVQEGTVLDAALTCRIKEGNRRWDEVPLSQTQQKKHKKITVWVIQVLWGAQVGPGGSWPQLNGRGASPHRHGVASG